MLFRLEHTFGTLVRDVIFISRGTKGHVFGYLDWFCIYYEDYWKRPEHDLFHSSEKHFVSLRSALLLLMEVYPKYFSITEWGLVQSEELIEAKMTLSKMKRSHASRTAVYSLSSWFWHVSVQTFPAHKMSFSRPFIMTQSCLKSDSTCIFCNSSISSS